MWVRIVHILGPEISMKHRRHRQHFALYRFSITFCTCAGPVGPAGSGTGAGTSSTIGPFVTNLYFDTQTAPPVNFFLVNWFDPTRFASVFVTFVAPQAGHVTGISALALFGGVSDDTTTITLCVTPGDSDTCAPGLQLEFIAGPDAATYHTALTPFAFKAGDKFSMIYDAPLLQNNDYLSIQAWLMITLGT